MYLASSYEMFFYARKGEARIVKQGRSNVLDYKPVPPQYKIHPTERPIEMIQDLISTFTLPNARVLVPFLGSGNTLLAANNLGMSAFGYELTKEYKDSFIVKVSTSKIGEFSSYRGQK
jgi:DNA modification methylase